jgi:DivIVA domain-containing protein
VPGSSKGIERIEEVTYSFSRSGKRKLGYSMSQVDEFLNMAREQYSDSSKAIVTSLEVRTMRFELEKDGYSISAVDSALEKLEDVFASSEFSQALSSVGYQQFTDELTEIKSLVLDRCRRPKRRRFARRAWPLRGYSTRQVDEFCSQIGNTLESDAQLTVKQVRVATFKSKRGGYAEYQVDAFIEKVVEVLQRQQAVEKISR